MPYRISEVAELLPTTIGTVQRWVKNGLKKIDGSYPFLIHGDDLKEFLQEKRSKRKMENDELWCCKCHKPRKAWGGLADIDFANPKSPQLKAICEVCEGKLNKRISLNALSEVQQIFKIQTLHNSPLI